MGIYGECRVDEDFWLAAAFFRRCPSLGIFFLNCLSAPPAALENSVSKRADKAGRERQPKDRNLPPLASHLPSHLSSRSWPCLDAMDREGCREMCDLQLCQEFLIKSLHHELRARDRSQREEEKERDGGRKRFHAKANRKLLQRLSLCAPCRRVFHASSRRNVPYFWCLDVLDVLQPANIKILLPWLPAGHYRKYYCH